MEPGLPGTCREPVGKGEEAEGVLDRVELVGGAGDVARAGGPGQVARDTRLLQHAEEQVKVAGAAQHVQHGAAVGDLLVGPVREPDQGVALPQALPLDRGDLAIGGVEQVDLVGDPERERETCASDSDRHHAPNSALSVAEGAPQVLFGPWGKTARESPGLTMAWSSQPGRPKMYPPWI